MSGKGSKARPLSVNKSTFDENWNKIFNKNQEQFTPTKDWYLIAINPWHKWYWNPKTNEHKHIPYK